MTEEEAIKSRDLARREIEKCVKGNMGDYASGFEAGQRRSVFPDRWRCPWWCDSSSGWAWLKGCRDGRQARRLGFRL